MAQCDVKTVESYYEFIIKVQPDDVGFIRQRRNVHMFMNQVENLQCIGNPYEEYGSTVLEQKRSRMRIPDNNMKNDKKFCVN